MATTSSTRLPVTEGGQQTERPPPPTVPPKRGVVKLLSKYKAPDLEGDFVYSVPLADLAPNDVYWDDDYQVLYLAEAVTIVVEVRATDASGQPCVFRYNNQERARVYRAKHKDGNNPKSRPAPLATIPGDD